MRNLAYIMLLSLLASFFACSDDFDDYSISSNDILTFSLDTVRFDTILSTINTPYTTLKVYNKNSKSLLISSIGLRDGDQGFKINVDGQAGSYFQNIEIRSKDSIYIFIDALPSESGQNLPFFFEDHIEFMTNGVGQEVVLEGSSQDVEIYQGKEITVNSILSNNKPYLIYDSLVIREGSTLSIQEGATLYMYNNAEIIVEGTLNIQGTPDSFVHIRGHRTDKMNTIPYEYVPGQWGGIRFSATSYNNKIEYAHIRNGNYGMNFDPSETMNTKLEMNNVILTNFKGDLINAINCKIIANNCELSNARGTLLNLIGGDYTFAHCTVVNLYESPTQWGWGNSDNRTVYLSDTYTSEEGEKTIYPLQQADFKNTLIWGRKYRTSSGVSLSSEKSATMNYYFLNCLLPNQGENDNDFVNCLFAEEPIFVKDDITTLKDPENPAAGEKYDFVYNLRLDSVSPLIDRGDWTTARTLPFDLDNKSRISDGGPDIGAYEYSSQ